MRRFYCVVIAAMTMLAAMAADVVTDGRTVTIRPDGGEARVVCLQVMNDRIIRVRATSKDELPQKPQSLMIVEQSEKPRFEVRQEGDDVRVVAAEVQAVVYSRT